MPTVTSFTRIKSDDAEGTVKNLKEAKKIIEKHGAEFLRVSRFHTGPWIGDWLVVVRFPNREAHGKWPGDGPQHHRRHRSLTTS